ncbi:MAG: DUF3006 domain-containing protein [Clostridiales bacterium]|nr:DUF3006 domain-containing protein [Clostridiales bacterium]
MEYENAILRPKNSPLEEFAMLVIDRFENGFALCENDAETLRIPMALIPSGAAEGDVLEQESGAYRVNAGATQHRRLLAAQKLKRLLASADDAE